MKTKLFLPDNIFSRILLSELTNTENISAEFLPSALIAKKVLSDENSIGLIPSLDILTFKDLFISAEIGVSFNALLSNSYIHYKEDQETIDQFFLKGDVTSNEIILSKILFKEFYDLEIIPSLAKDDAHSHDNIIIVGDENYSGEKFLNGLSFSEEIIELLDTPYVNFLIAGSTQTIVQQFNHLHRHDFLNGHKENQSEILGNLPPVSMDFININMQHVVYDFEDQDLEGIKTLLQLPYFHGIVKDMIDLKFV